jgi:hypothetical protein
MLSVANQVRDWDIRAGPDVFKLAGGTDENVQDLRRLIQNTNNRNENEVVKALEYEDVMIDDGSGKVVKAAPLYHAVYKGNHAIVTELLRHPVDLTKSINYPGIQSRYSLPCDSYSLHAH